MEIKDERKIKINSCNFDAPFNINKYLINFLSPTSSNTNYWDSPTEANIEGLSIREISRIVNQATEINDIINRLVANDEKKNINFLDVGTGNGMVPKFLNILNKKINSTAIDPYLHGGHKTSWQKSKLDKDIEACIDNYKSKNLLKNIDINYDFQERYLEKKLFLEEHINQTFLFF